MKVKVIIKSSGVIDIDGYQRRLYRISFESEIELVELAN